MKVALLASIIAIALLAQTVSGATTACSTTGTGTQCSSPTAQCTATTTTLGSGSTTGGTCTAACSHASGSSTYCYDSANSPTTTGAYLYCTLANSAYTCTSTPTTGCTTNAGCATATETVNVQCAYTGSGTTKGCLRQCAVGAATNAFGRCADSSTNFCSSTGTCILQSCTNSGTCSSDSSNAQCVVGTSGSTTTYTCQSQCNHNTGAYCYDTQATSPKVYCVSNACATAPTVASSTCSSNCATCSSATVCTACKQGYGLTGSGSNVTCVACDKSCSECLNGASNTSCVSYKYPLDGAIRTDVSQANANCSSGYAPGAIATGGTYTCYNCSTNCTSCTSPNTAAPATSNTPAICLACASGSYLNGTVSVLNSTSNTNTSAGYNCIGCPANCTSCTNSTYCIKCNGSLVWNNSTKKCFGANIATTFVLGSIIGLAAFML